MSNADTVRTLIDFLLIVFAIFLLTKEEKVANWERRTLRKALRWAVKHIPSFRVWLYGKGDAEHMPVRLINDWRNIR